jgi:YYY domain-containing protein
MLIISYAIYVLGILHIFRFNTLNIIVVWITFTSIIIFLFRNDKFEIRKHLRIFLFEELIFFTTLVIWSFVRAHQPDIHDLEKFMDYGFINSILRSEYFPPKDMWLTPFSINYYYFGHLYTGVITKLSSIPSFISFNLMISTIFAFTFTLSFSIGINLIQRIKNFSLKTTVILSILFAYVISLGGNLQTIYSLFKTYDPESPLPFWKLTLSPFSFPNAYWYPNATRFIYHTIHEFPSYSFVVADLHGHVLDIPVVITLISLALILFLEKRIRIAIILLLSFLISIAYMTNAWDGLIYIGLFINIIFSIEILRNNNPSTIKKILHSIVKSFKYIFIIGALFFILTFVFSQNFVPFASEIGLNCAPEFLLKIEKVGPFLFERGQCQHSPIWQLGILYGFFIFILIGFFIFIKNKKKKPTDYFIAITHLL